MSQVAGLNPVAALLQEAPERVRVLHVLRERRDRRMAELVSQARDHGIRVEFVDRRWLDARSDVPHQGIIAECHARALANEAALESAWPDLPSPRLILVLDGIQDPRNLGACVRSANAAGVQAVLLPRRRSAPLTEAALKTAAGGAEGLLIVEVANLARRIEWLKAQGVWIFGADGSGEANWTQVDLRSDVAIVMGNEGEGMRALTRQLCDHVVRIPMLGSVESLNVSVAAGILLFEVVRQRMAASD